MSARERERGSETERELFSARDAGCGSFSNSGLQQEKEENSKVKKRKYVKISSLQVGFNSNFISIRAFHANSSQMDLLKGKASTK